jgi:hypothetical protein
VDEADLAIPTRLPVVDAAGARRRRGVDRGFVMSDHADSQGFSLPSRAPALSAYLSRQRMDGALVERQRLTRKVSKLNTATTTNPPLKWRTYRLTAAACFPLPPLTYCAVIVHQQFTKRAAL